MQTTSTREQATKVSEILPGMLTGKTFWNGFGVVEDKDMKGSFVAVVYLNRRRIPKDSLPKMVEGVKVVPMYLGGQKPQTAHAS